MDRRASLTCTVLAALALSGGACDEGGDTSESETDGLPECVSYELDACALLYPPTYAQVWTQTLSTGCAQVGGACHAQGDAAGAIHGLTFTDPQLSWDHMLAGDAALVSPGDPLCSPLFVRLAIDDPSLRMPPGASGLDPKVLCSVGTWIADGAMYEQP